jgi:hypothetical protein
MSRNRTSTVSTGFDVIVAEYLTRLKKEIARAPVAQPTRELSYRPTLDGFLNQVANYINSDIEVTPEPRSQGRAGRPDWRFYNSRTLSLYGYVEAKGVEVSTNISPAAHVEQLSKYLDLGADVILTDGIEFIFFEPGKAASPERFTLLPKPVHWSNPEPTALLESRFRRFFDTTGFRFSSEEQLIKEVAKRARPLAEIVRDHADLGLDEARNKEERKTIKALGDLKTVLAQHHDPALRTPKVFADFVAQVLMFGLLYAHRVCGGGGTPIERRDKIRRFWSDAADSESAKQLRPFRALVELLGDELKASGQLGIWYQDCLLFLAHIELEEDQRENPDYHILYERFLQAYDPDTRFDFGAFYTPQELAAFTVKLSKSIIDQEFPGVGMYRKENKVIDPCCGTGTFLEQLILQSDADTLPTIAGFEILPAPYALAHYRLAMLRQSASDYSRVSVILTNTLSNELLREEIEEDTTPTGTPNLFDLIEEEQRAARKHARPPLTLVIGNPPASESYEHATGADFGLINSKIDDFRPPSERRGGRQNTQRALQNPFVKFLRWSCAKLLDDGTPGVMALILPSAFAENASYRYARKYITDNFTKVWVLEIDADTRTGIRTENIFRTLQGRLLLIAVTGATNGSAASSVSYTSITELSRTEKAAKLVEIAASSSPEKMFKPVNYGSPYYNFKPSKPFDDEAYSMFWSLQPDTLGTGHIFERHNNGLKLAPSGMFVHSNLGGLKRRSRAIARLADNRSNVEEVMREWFVGQSRPPAASKFTPAVVSAFGNATASDDSYISYAFRPFTYMQALISEDVLATLARMPNSGTRYRPEVLAAFRDDSVVGIAVAPGPKELGATLHRFAAFCWALPDNDLCSRGNAMILCNKFPDHKNSQDWDATPRNNINTTLVERLEVMLGVSSEEIARSLVFYSYGVLSSATYLERFEGELFRTADSENGQRIPIPDDAETFRTTAELGRKLAEAEKPDTEVVIEPHMTHLIALYAEEFRLNTDAIDVQSGTIELRGDNGVTLRLEGLRSEVLDFKVAGYTVVKQWLKFHSHRYTRTNFTREHYIELLELLTRIESQFEIVQALDAQVERMLDNGIALLESRPAEGGTTGDAA